MLRAEAKHQVFAYSLESILAPRHSYFMAIGTVDQKRTHRPHRESNPEFLVRSEECFPLHHRAVTAQGTELDIMLRRYCDQTCLGRVLWGLLVRFDARWQSLLGLFV